MKKMIFISCVFLLSACMITPTPEAPLINAPQILLAEDNPFAPEVDDDGLISAGVILTSINLVERGEFAPARVELRLFGSMPSVCNQLRVKINPPSVEYKIFINAYSVADPKINCENVFQQFETSILLGVYSAGRYEIWVNNEYVGDFISY